MSAKTAKLLFTNKNVHILIGDGGKRKSRCPCAFFSVFGQVEKGRDVGTGKFVGDRRFT
jgi:hypothetical protein